MKDNNDNNTVGGWLLLIGILLLLALAYIQARESGALAG
jgi:hypothetical protein